MDRRTERTRHALRSAFVELVLTRGYDAVTVADIIERANVGRSTFYLHYAGREALLQQSLEGPCSGLAACVGGEVSSERLAPVLDHLREQWNVNRVFFEHPLRSLCVKSLAALIERELARLPGLSGAGRIQTLIPGPLMALLLAETQVALITHWLAGAVPVKPQRLAQALLVNTQALLASGGFNKSAPAQRAIA
jgi:AcrR family transcriptional regulator